MAKLVDALDLGSSGLCRVGSSPIRRTEKILTAWYEAVRIFFVCQVVEFSECYTI